MTLLRTEAPRLARLFQQSVQQRNAREARRAVHTLKSNFRNVGLTHAAEMAGRFETLAHQSSWNEIESQAHELQQTIEQVQDWCGQMLKQRTPV